MTLAFRQRKAASILDRLLEIGVRLSGWNNLPLVKKTFVFIIVHLFINAYIWVSFWVIQFMHTNIRGVIITFSIYLPPCIIYVFIYEYIVVLGLIGRGIESGNNTLMDLGWNENRLPNSQLSIIYLASQRRDQLASLRVLKSIRIKLPELCADVEDFFSLPILFCVGSAFVPISCLLYRYIFNAYSQKNNVVGVSLLAAFTFTMTLMCLYPVTSLAFNVTKTVQEAKRTRRIINKLMADDKLMTQEIKALNSSTFAWRTTPRFYGLWTFHPGLFAPALDGGNSTTTYRIILIQF